MSSMCRDRTEGDDLDAIIGSLLVADEVVGHTMWDTDHHGTGRVIHSLTELIAP